MTAIDGPQQAHLQDLGALLLAAGEAVVDVAAGEGLVHLEQRQGVHADAGGTRAPARRVPCTALRAARRKLTMVTPGIDGRVLHGQEEARAGRARPAAGR